MQHLQHVPESQRSKLVICSDRYYLDDRSRSFLRSHRIMYLCAVNKTCFPELWKDLDKRVTKVGEWAMSYNEETGEVAVVEHSAQYGMMRLLTNAFAVHHTETEMKYNIPSFFYQTLFHVNDILHGYFHGKEFPYKRRNRRRGGFKVQYDEFHWMVLLWNVFTAFHETYKIEGERSFHADIKELSKQLWAHTQTLRLHE